MKNENENENEIKNENENENEKKILIYMKPFWWFVGIWNKIHYFFVLFYFSFFHFFSLFITLSITSIHTVLNENVQLLHCMMFKCITLFSLLFSCTVLNSNLAVLTRIMDTIIPLYFYLFLSLFLSLSAPIRLYLFYFISFDKTEDFFERNYYFGVNLNKMK